MKKPLICLCAGVMLFTGRMHHRLRHDDEKRTNHHHRGKPKLDKDTGMTSYTDQDGNAREINSNDVAQLIEAN